MKIVQDQLIELAASRLIVNVTAPGDKKLVVGIQLHRPFVRITLTVFQPANHPLVDGFPTHKGSAMPTRSDEEAYLVLSAVKLVPTSGFLIDKLRPRRREAVLPGGPQQPA